MADKKAGKKFASFRNFICSFVPHALKLEYCAWRVVQKDRKRIGSIQESIKEIETRWPDLVNNITDSPIFIFSAGWRSGSTLLQRLVMSDKRVMIWGEPFKHCNFVRMHAASLCAINIKYPINNWFLSKIKAQNSQQLTYIFIANLYPEMRYLQQAHQNFFLSLLAKSAIDNNYSRWGLKEVRLGIDDAIYLKWLFPHAKFIFLYRNPYGAYASLRPHLIKRKWSLYET